MIVVVYLEWPEEKTKERKSNTLKHANFGFPMEIPELCNNIILLTETLNNLNYRQLFYIF